jgi:hypothetical protein
MKAKITWKELKDKSSVHVYTSPGRKVIAIFFDWKTCDPKGEGKYWGGYKYLIRADSKYATREELFDYLYRWVNQGLFVIPQIIDHKITKMINYTFAETDEERFKIPLSISI